MSQLTFMHLFRHFLGSGKVLNRHGGSQGEHFVVRFLLQKRPTTRSGSFRHPKSHILAVREMPGDRLKALVRFGPLVFRAALGRGGIRNSKREGDGCTPRACMTVLAGFRRGGMLSPDCSGVPLTRVTEGDGWCDAPGHAAYNRQVRLPFAASHEKLIRKDILYDFGFVLDWNIAARKRGAGSAIFLHVANPGLPPTQGCIALERRDMLRLMPLLRRGTMVRVV